MVEASPSVLIQPLEGDLRLNSAMMPDCEACRLFRMERRMFGLWVSCNALSGICRLACATSMRFFAKISFRMSFMFSAVKFDITFQAGEGASALQRFASDREALRNVFVPLNDLDGESSID